MFTTIGIIILILIILGVLGGGIMIFSHLLVAVIHTTWKFLGLIVFIFFIYQMYKIGNHEKTYSVDNNLDYDNSTLIVNGNQFTYIFEKDDEYIKKQESISGKVDINILNKFETVIIKNPKCDKYSEEKFDKSDIEFVNSHEYIDGHRDDLKLKYR
jgi:hypothetical protein